MRGILAPVLVLALSARGPVPVAPSARPGDRYDQLILRYSQQSRLSPRLLKAVIAAESGFQPRAVSRKDARGLMQLMPETAEEMGVPRRRLHEPEPNIRAGTAYLDWLFRALCRRHGVQARRLGDAPLWAQRRVLAAYNGGPRFLNSDRWPQETRRYVRRIERLSRAPLTELRRHRQAGRSPVWPVRGAGA